MAAVKVLAADMIRATWVPVILFAMVMSTMIATDQGCVNSVPARNAVQLQESRKVLDDIVRRMDVIEERSIKRTEQIERLQKQLDASRKQ